MKKYTTIILAAFAAASFGASIDWNIVHNANNRLNSPGFGSTGSHTGAANSANDFVGFVYMIFASDAQSLINFTATDASTAKTDFQTFAENKAFGSSFMNIDSSKGGRDVSIQTVSDNRLTWQIDYSVALLFWDPAAGMYWISGAITATAYDPAQLAVFPKETFGFAVAGDGNPINGDRILGTWTPVKIIPEPTTAGLALAGLALLFRRKRK